MNRPHALKPLQLYPEPLIPSPLQLLRQRRRPQTLCALPQRDMEAVSSQPAGRQQPKGQGPLLPQGAQWMSDQNLELLLLSHLNTVTDRQLKLSQCPPNSLNFMSAAALCSCRGQAVKHVLKQDPEFLFR